MSQTLNKTERLLDKVARAVASLQEDMKEVKSEFVSQQVHLDALEKQHEQIIDRLTILLNYQVKAFGDSLHSYKELVEQYQLLKKTERKKNRLGQ